jgi:phage gp46-like protein
MNITTAILLLILATLAIRDGRLREWWADQGDKAKILYGCAGFSLAVIIALRMAGFLNY